MIIFLFLQYLERNNIKEFGRENFSFNTRVKVGQFFEGQAGTAVSGTCLKKTSPPEKDLSSSIYYVYQLFGSGKRDEILTFFNWILKWLD